MHNKLHIWVNALKKRLKIEKFRIKPGGRSWELGGEAQWSKFQILSSNIFKIKSKGQEVDSEKKKFLLTIYIFKGSF